MTYPEFRETIFEILKEMLPKDVSIRLLDVEKLNNSLRHGILFTKDKVPFSSTIYLEPFFKAFVKGRDMYELAKDLLCCYEEETIELPKCVFDLSDYETAKENIFARLIHLEQNKNLLKDTPYLSFLDFAIVTYFEIDSEELYQGSVLLKDNLVKNWKVTKEELLLWALQNTKDKKEMLFKDMAEVLENHLSEEEKHIYRQQPSGMYVLTNTQKYFGTILVYFPEVLQKIHRMIGEDYYLLPASIHEWIVIPMSNAGDSNFLKQMVQQINRSELLPEEVLSNEIYFYNSDTQNIHICQSTNDKKY